MRIPSVIFSLLALSLSISAETVEVGIYPAKVTPEQLDVLSIGEQGIVTQLSHDKVHYKKGEIIARVNEEDLKDAKEDLEINILSDRITRRDNIRTLQKQRKELEFYFSLTEREQRYATDIQVDGEPPTKQALEDIDERIELAERELERAPKRMTKEFEKKEEASSVIMPFDGRIQFQIVLPDKDEVFETKPIPHFATAIDDSAFYIAIPITQAVLTQLPTEKFSASIDLPAGKKLVGTFSHRRLEKSGSSEGFVYYFILPEDQADLSFSLLGSTAQTKLLYEVSDKLKRVNMHEHYSGDIAENSRDKEELIKKSFPGYNLLLETDEELILIPEGEEP